MCFAPQRRALFPHLNRSWCALYVLTCKCASRHNGVQFFISHLARWLRTRRFSEPTFRPSGDTNHWKNALFRDFPAFSRICIFFLLTLSLLLFFLLIFLFSLPLPCSAFHLSILSEVWLLNFLPQLQLQLHYTDYTPLQLQLHYATTTTTAAQQDTTSSSCGWGDHCNHCKHSKKHNSNLLSVHQWIRSAIHASQQLTSPIVSYLWNFRHRLVRYYILVTNQEGQKMCGLCGLHYRWFQLSRVFEARYCSMCHMGVSAASLGTTVPPVSRIHLRDLHLLCSLTLFDTSAGLVTSWAIESICNSTARAPDCQGRTWQITSNYRDPLTLQLEGGTKVDQHHGTYVTSFGALVVLDSDDHVSPFELLTCRSMDSNRNLWGFARSCPVARVCCPVSNKLNKLQACTASRHLANLSAQCHCNPYK